MSDYDDLEPRLGRIRSLGKARARSYVGRVVKAANLARGGAASGRGRRGFSGARIGRGAGVGHVLASRDRFSALRQRRVIIKTRIVRLDGPKGLAPALAHLRYVERDGTTRDGGPGRLYSADADSVDRRAFIDRQDGDRHHMRFIVSPEDGASYDDLKSLTRRLMAQVEMDLGTKLDWVAVDHFNTAHPHTHIIVRGKDDRGKDLIIARHYLSQGMRERAAELVSLDLGPRSDVEIADRLRAEVSQERLTSLDRRLLRDLDAGGVVVAFERDPFQQTLRAGRLQTLGRLGLARELGAGRWALAPDCEETLRRMGERGDIIRTMQRAFTAHGVERPGLDAVIADPSSMRPIVGRVIERGLSDELNDRHYLIVDAADGRIHYVDIGRGETTERLPAGAVVRIRATPTDARAADRTVAEIAASNGGSYSVDLHLRHDASATQDFAETHVRRLEAMRKAGAGVEREADGRWLIAPDHVARAAAFEARRAKAAPVVVDRLSKIPLERQATFDGATWLDRELVASGPEATRDAGFGQEIAAAKARRMRWLVGQHLAEEDQGKIVYRRDMLAQLRRREMSRVAGTLSDELGLGYVESRSGDRIEGVYRRPVDLASGRVALIEKSREFTLVPWRPVLDRHIGRTVSGVMKGDGVNWTIGRGRGGPSIT
ncbi:relaxase/mobilization nuclease RlxS [Brevundimonas diminuta]|uniref:relaxase/mobilization nuclease RlxS n=1 Tax=Brevundimonas diminuta TaxID=293 RepID=UPI0022AEEA46|nr:relaxase/mobilization nuclease RlxS [Brevundimonas diminuta]MCZ4107970.1 relaxase/mobilization nuclease RlxS [Brevundimonas diminuta]